MSDVEPGSEGKPRKSGRGCCGCLAGLALAPVALFALFVGGIWWGERKHVANRAHLQEPAVANAVARELALLCQSLPSEMSDGGTGFAWLPEVVRECHPHWGSVGPEGAHLEMHGGFDHYGYRLDKDLTASNAARTTWVLSYYTEQGGSVLCSVALGADEKLSEDQLVAKGLEGYDALLAERPKDQDLHQAKIQFLLRWKRLEPALAAAKVSVEASPDEPLPRLTVAHLRARTGAHDAAAKDFADWVHASPDYARLTWLFLFYLREGKTPEALAAIREWPSQPFVEGFKIAKSKYYLGCSGAVFAAAHGDPALATTICDFMEKDGAPDPYWAAAIAKVRVGVKAQDPGFEAWWVKEYHWPNPYMSNSTEQDWTDALYPARSP